MNLSSVAHLHLNLRVWQFRRRPQINNFDPTSSHTYLKLVRLPLSTWALFIPRIDCGLLFHYDPACLNVFVSRVVQPGLPEFGTLLAHIWPRGAQADALEDLINLFGSIDLEWSHPPGSNRRPADYEPVRV